MTLSSDYNETQNNTRDLNDTSMFESKVSTWAPATLELEAGTNTQNLESLSSDQNEMQSQTQLATAYSARTTSTIKEGAEANEKEAKKSSCCYLV